MDRPARAPVRFLVPLALVAAVLLAAGVARGGPPGTWTRITDPTAHNIDQLGLARTADGVLHVAWLRQAGTQTDLVASAVSPAGSVVGSPATIVGGWATLTNPALVVQPDGSLLALFAGVRSTDTSDPYSGGTVYSATAPAAGTAWTLAPGSAAPPSSAYASDDVGAAVAGGGAVVTSWATTFGTDVHVGLDSATPSLQLQSSCCGYQTALGVDGATGAVLLGWYSNASDGQGIYAQTVAPSQGPRWAAPGSVTTYNGQPSSLSVDQVVAVSGRHGAAGVYLGYVSGYPTARTVDLWRAGDAKPAAVVAAEDARHVALAPGPQGRLWLVWDAHGVVFATRTNKAATRLGPVSQIKPPPGTETIYKTRGEGSPGPLDLFVLAAAGNGTLAAWHTQVLPRLTLAAQPASFAARTGATVVLTVADAGDPVAGATVKVSGHTLVTNAQGKATLSVPRGAPRRLSAIAARAGYTGASATIRAR